MKTTNQAPLVSIDREKHTLIKVIAAQMGITIKQVINDALADYLNKHKAKRSL